MAKKKKDELFPDISHTAKIRKQLKKNRNTRNIREITDAREEDNALEGQTLKERIEYLKELNGRKNEDLLKEKKSTSVNIESLEDDVLIERPLPMTMASTLYPIKDIRKGLIITNDNRYVRIMEVLPINFQLKAPLEQEIVTNAFEQFLRVAPERFQIKSVAKKTDISFFTHKMDEDYAREKNPKCREMILDGKQFLYELGASESVSRRYFFIFEVPDRMTKNATLEDIQDRSLSLCVQCETFLGACGNKVADGYDDSETVAKMIFDMMNRTKSSSVDFDDHVNSVCSFYERNYGAKAIDLIPMGELVTPFRIDMRGSDFIKLDDIYYGFLYIKGSTLPMRVYSGWITNLTNMGEGVDFDLFVEQQRRSTQAERIRRNLLWKKHDISGMSDTTQDYDNLSGALASGYYLKEGLSGGNEFYYTSCMLTVTASSIKGLRKRMDYIKEDLRSKRIEVGKLSYEQDRAFSSYLPLCSLDRKIFARARRNVLTEGLASYYPFTSSEICDENGILIGINEMSGSICHADFFDTSQYKNANIAILGCTGAGKSYLLQTLALRFRKKGIQVFIIAPDKGHEFM